MKAALGPVNVQAGHSRAEIETSTASSTLPPESPLLRAFDLAVCLLVLPLALLLGALTALLTHSASPGSVFYRSTRVGRDGRNFEMLKFRKMRRTATGGPLTVHDDERFTPIGRFLSLTKLDELPQLWNVIRGEMRLVGPRPEVPEFVERYPREYRQILSVLPGITGPAAVEYASESHLLTLQHDPLNFYQEQIMPRKLEIDLDYIHSRTLAGDVGLLLRTALVPLSKVLQRSLHSPRARRFEAGLLLSACAVLAFAFALASSSGAATTGCGGASYCIPRQSTFAFTSIARSAHRCSAQVDFTVDPQLAGASGYAHLELRGTSRRDRRIDRTARTLVSGGSAGYRFTKLVKGPYQLSGWYEGDSARTASAHVSKRFTLRCG